MILNHNTKFGCKWFTGSEDVIWTNSICMGHRRGDSNNTTPPPPSQPSTSSLQWAEVWKWNWLCFSFVRFLLLLALVPPLSLASPTSPPASASASASCDCWSSVLDCSLHQGLLCNKQQKYDHCFSPHICTTCTLLSLTNKVQRESHQPIANKAPLSPKLCMYDGSIKAVAITPVLQNYKFR